ncbi:NAD(P)/FAD-dependent oxidoreductase [Flavisolibacter tropicus]|uniref:FAD-dependent oxidoreductase n=1 Tax=Flavisolibacter tropicus TaxID=1492898 RepID=A0A172TTD6_9BACT|nr:FAD-dependent oxidoreductase [Flavisolibacter tropicus]ANE50371.1 FAD-dependent oxidoreductase [Flavisolibacter tropicus]
MTFDFLIVGQGICGTMLSWFLHKEGKSILVIDEGKENTSSKVAAGLINPITGRRYVTSWMIDELIPFAKETYTSIGSYLGHNFIQEKGAIDFFTSPQMRDAFVNRITEDDTYLHPFPDQNHFNQYFNYDFGCGQVRPAFIVNLSGLLQAWRLVLKNQNAILEEHFDLNALQVTEDGIKYGEISAQKIIFCDGITSMNNPWFELLPFSANKGEALIIHSEELINEYIFKKGMILAPLQEQNMFWVGSNYQWEFEDDKPTEKFYEQTLQHLKNWLKVPFEVVAHKAAVRPATVERRPFVGLHPHLPSVGIFNGMGTKGTSLAPFFANQLVQHVVHGLPIMPEADVHRFSRILAK